MINNAMNNKTKINIADIRQQVYEKFQIPEYKRNSDTLAKITGLDKNKFDYRQAATWEILLNRTFIFEADELAGDGIKSAIELMLPAISSEYLKSVDSINSHADALGIPHFPAELNLSITQRSENGYGYDVTILIESQENEHQILKEFLIASPEDLSSIQEWQMRDSIDKNFGRPGSYHKQNPLENESIRKAASNFQMLVNLILHEMMIDSIRLTKVPHFKCWLT